MVRFCFLKVVVYNFMKGFHCPEYSRLAEYTIGMKCRVGEVNCSKDLSLCILLDAE